MSDMQKDLAEVVRSLAKYDIKRCTYTLGVACSAVNFIDAHHATILQDAEDAEKYRNNGLTHAEGCYTWGPKHYECVLRKLEDNANAALRLRALEQAITERAHTLDGDYCHARADELLREWKPKS